MRFGKLIYIAGPYSGVDDEQVQKHIDDAEIAAVELMRRGWSVICPHKNTAYLNHYGIEYEDFIAADLTQIERCDAIFMLDGWFESAGSQRELAHAIKCGIVPLFQADGYPELDTPTKPADMLFSQFSWDWWPQFADKWQARLEAVR